MRNTVVRAKAGTGGGRVINRRDNPDAFFIIKRNDNANTCKAAFSTFLQAAEHVIRHIGAMRVKIM